MNHCKINSYTNQVEIYFDGKPEGNARTQMKSNHWRWNPNGKCWYNENNNSNVTFAEMICKYCNADIRGYHVYPLYDNRKPLENWEIESIFKKNGYSVSSEAGLDAISRQTILKNMIRAKVVGQTYIIYFLSKRIETCGNNKNFVGIVKKYKNDLEFANSDEFTDFCKKHA